MKLLSSRETETHTTAETLAESRRVSAIRSQLSREELELNDWRDSIDLKKQVIEQELNSTVFSLNEKIIKLQGEVVLLEAERAELLRPLDDTPEKITENLAVTENLLNYLQKRKKEVLGTQKLVKEAQERAEKQLLDLLQRENWLNQRVVQIETKEKGIKTEELGLAKSVATFTDEANKKNIELMLFEGKLNKHEVELAEREKIIAGEKEQIAKDRKRIESQQQTLIAAMAEAKNKNLI